MRKITFITSCIFCFLFLTSCDSPVQLAKEVTQKPMYTIFKNKLVFNPYIRDRIKKELGEDRMMWCVMRTAENEGCARVEIY